MSQSITEYAEKTAQGGWRIAGTRISLDSIIQAYWDGKSPEAIVQDFPTLSNEQVYGVIAYYLRHKVEIDDYLVQQQSKWRALAAESELKNGALLDRLRAQRRSEKPE